MHRTPYPPRPKLPEHPTHRDLQAYVTALGNRASVMSREEHVADWRKAHPRTKHKGGDVTAMIAAGRLTSLKYDEGTNAKRCTATTRRGTPCHMVAVRGMSVCYFHGGKAECLRRDALRGIPPKTKAMSYRSAGKLALKTGALPAELTSHPAFRLLSASKNKRDWPVLFRLIEVYLIRPDNPEPWITMLAALKKSGRI